MGCEVHYSKYGRRPIRDAGGALEDLSCGKTGRGKLWPFQVEDFCGDNTSGVLDRVVGYRVHIVGVVPVSQEVGKL